MAKGVNCADEITINGQLVGTLTLNYVKVRFHGKLDLASLEGRGYLEVLEEVEPGAA